MLRHFASCIIAFCVPLLGVPAFGQEARAGRIPLVPADTDDPIVAPIFAGIRARGGEPLNMHRTVANAPKVFKPYVDLAVALRTSARVPRPDRELAILRAAQHAHGDYEFVQHRPMAASCGMTAAQIEALQSWRKSTLFTDRQRAILAYVDGMASAAGVDDATFATLQHFYTPQEIVELTLTAAFYAASSQVTRALGVKLEKNAGQTAYGKC